MPKVYAEWSFPVKLCNDIEKDRIKHIQFTNVDNDSNVESTKVSIQSLEQLRQIRVDHFKTLFLMTLRRCYPQPALVTAVAPYHLVAVI